MPDPRITICLPIYNAERFLAEAVQSLRAQTFVDFEVIAVLDGCTDRSEQILLELKDARFEVIRKERNEGVLAASNLALARARGEFYGRMDADDTLEPQRLERQYEFLRTHPDVAVVGTYFDYIDERGRRIKSAYPFPTEHAAIREAFRRHSAIGGATALCRTDRLRAIGGYGAEFPIAEDYALWLKCLAAGYRLANIPEVLYHYRQYGVQSSTQRRAEMLRLTNLAYQMYGRAIWGDDAPDFELGAPLWKRAQKRLRRIFGRRRKPRG